MLVSEIVFFIGMLVFLFIGMLVSEIVFFIGMLVCLRNRVFYRDVGFRCRSRHRISIVFLIFLAFRYRVVNGIGFQ